MSDTPATLKAKEAEATTLNYPEEKQQAVVDLSYFIEPHDSTPPVLSFAVEEHQRNTVDNPDRENTNTLPVLVRRVNSEELLPCPLKTTNQLLCVSYLSTICCLCFGACAVNHAWEAKEKRNAGVLSGAVKEVQASCRCMKVALGVGLCMWLAVIVLVAVYYI